VHRKLPPTLSHAFRDEQLLEQALTHRSAGNPHNERLEFLGDAILGLVVAEELYRRFPDANEGQLTRLRACLVRKETLGELAAAAALGDQLVLGEGELKSGGFRRESILANALEALLGAIFLDAGFADCRSRILALYANRFEGLSPEELSKDAKTELQEWLQARRLPLPVYRLVRTQGDPHDQRFFVECEVAMLSEPVHGDGRSRRIAEQQAAAIALRQLSAEITPDHDQ
jgi:ribonuclease III